MKEPTLISITSGTIVRIILWLVVFAGLYYVRDFLVALLVSVVLASAAELPVKAMMRSGLPRWMAVSVIFVALLALVVAIAFIFLPPLAEDLAQFAQSLPKILDSVRIFGRDMGFKDLSSATLELSRNIDKGQILTVIKNTFFGTSGIFATSAAFIGGVFNLILTFVLAFYLALEERGVQKFLRLIVPKTSESYVEDLWARSQRKIGLWMQGQLLLSLLVSLLVYIPMLILNIPYPALLGILAFCGELVPLVGLTFSVVPALFLAWTQGGASLLAVVGAIYFIISQLEGHVLYPRVMNKMVGVPSVIVIIALVMGAKFAGIWGVLLSVPMAAILMELASDLDKRKQAHIG
jgi:predicted PurR-regulated permease PerM